MKDTLTVEVSPIDALLREQKSLQTPVVDFSVYRDALLNRFDTQKEFSRLIPLSEPSEGQQYAFEVDLDRCTGCKACVAACHQMNGLSDEESWRDVGILVGNGKNGAYQQTVTTACHHCEEPGCLEGCPVLAYEKDEVTGIVRHLDDQCIGCQYCILKCPYDVPKYNEQLGIVRKCDMCYQRLSEGESPACVQACPTEAIRIVTVDSNKNNKIFSEDLLPSSPPSNLTKPTTKYVTKKQIPNQIRAGDLYALKVEPEHKPLVWMLVLNQFSLGILLFNGLSLAISSGHFLVGGLLPLVLMGVGLTASTLHLGRPLGAWRAFLGFKTSWLSREIVAFGNYFLALIFLAASGFIGFSNGLIEWIWAGATISGMLAVFTSVMVYHDTHRKSWNWKIVSVKFFGTAMYLGGIVYIAVNQFMENENSVIVMAILGFVFVVKFTLEYWQKQVDTKTIGDGLWRTARLLDGPLKSHWTLRWLTAFGVVTLLVLGMEFHPLFTVSAIGVAFYSELKERSLFFKSSDAMRMPGGFGV